MVQKLLPDGTITEVNWSPIGASTIWEALLDTSDSKFIESVDSPISLDAAEVSLTDSVDPLDNTNHKVFYRYRKNAVGGQTINLTVSLFQGTSLIKLNNHNDISNVFTNGSFTLSESEASLITDYSDLRIRFEASGGGGSPSRRAQVSYGYMEIPDVPYISIGQSSLFHSNYYKTLIKHSRILSESLLVSSFSNTNSILLFLAGHQEIIKPLSLFAAVDNSNDEGLDVPLFIHGSSSGEHFLYNSVSLYLDSVSGNLLNRSVPLYVLAPLIGVTYGGMNLFVGSDISIRSAVDLYLHNKYYDSCSGVILYVRGSGINDGYLEYNRGFDLWIQRPTSNILSLYLLSEGLLVSNNMNHFIAGCLSTSSGIILVVPDVVGDNSNNITMYTHGF